jgi:hypothetical protein
VLSRGRWPQNGAHAVCVLHTFGQLEAASTILEARPDTAAPAYRCFYGAPCDLTRRVAARRAVRAAAAQRIARAY